MEFQNPTPTFQEYIQQHPSNDPRGPGQYSRSQLEDLKSTWEQMYYPNAFQAAMLNYQNEWQSPINQMLRYQQAGLNPYSFQSQQSASGSQGSVPAPQFGNRELTQKKIQNVISGVSSLSGALGVAKDLYDYIRFGKDRSFYQTALTKNNAEAASFAAAIKEQEMAWSQYWNGATRQYDSEGNDMGIQIWDPLKSPRAQYMANSSDRIAKQIDQLDYMVKFLYPSQKDLNEARKALLAYQKEIMAGHNDAVLNINTGNATADAILKFLLYLLSENLPSVGFSGKF